MPGRSGRDEKQAAQEPGSFASVMHQFGKSLGLVHDDPDPPNATPAPTTPVPPKTPIGQAADKLQARTQQIDATVDQAAK
jgi:hypothetical protein